MLPSITTAVLTVLFCSGVFILWAELLRRYWKIPLLAALPVTLSLIVGSETIFLNILSLLNLVTAPGVLGFHAVICTAGILLLRQNFVFKRWYCRIIFLKRVCLNNAFILFFLLLVLIGISCFVYPPNNYDSVVYHMGRVAHWIQNQSVEYYPTSIERQNVMGPGAEYLVLIPQLICKSDVFANSVQYLSYIILFFSILYFTRLFRINRQFGNVITLLTVTSPMAVLQASSTQNDLVAVVMTFAIIISARRFWYGDGLKAKWRDYALLGICLASGFLVKPTSLLVAAPFLIMGVCFQLLRIYSTPLKIVRYFNGCLVILTLVLLIAGPDIARKEEQHIKRWEVYPLCSKWDSKRLQNPIATIGHNIPDSEFTNKVLRKTSYGGPFESRYALTVHEDLIGSPYQVICIMTLFIMTLFFSPILLWRRKLCNTFVLSLLPVLAWIIFGWIVKDQLWISRLQLPLIFLLPFSFLFVYSLGKSKTYIRNGVTVVTAGIALLSWVYSVVIACQNPHRPIKAELFWGKIPDRTWTLYNNALHETRISHQNLLNTARAQNCRYVGLLLGNNSVDYPITWRMMQEGRATKHIISTSTLGEKDWPCIIFAEKGNEKRVCNIDTQWISIDEQIYRRNLKWEFENSASVLLDTNSPTFELNSIKAVNANILRENGRFVITVENNDPQLYLPVKTAQEKGWGVLRVLFDKEAESSARLYYKSIKSKQYEESNSQRCYQGTADRKGECYFLIELEDIESELRFDPGDKVKEYAIKNLEIRTVVPKLNAKQF